MKLQQRQFALVALLAIFIVALLGGIGAYRWYHRKPSYLIDQTILDQTLSRAQETESDTVIIWHDGEILLNWSSEDAPERFGLMSITKSITSILLGMLMNQSKLTSFDIPVYELFPEWKQGNKQRITLRHLMNHTSGIQENLDVFKETVPAPNAIQLALAAELVSEPGESFFYNNKATNLLAGIIERIAHEPLDAYAKENLFQPLDIEDIDWWKDKAGNPYVMAGLHMKPLDLLKIGQLILQYGTWEGKRLIDKKWFDEALKQSQPYLENNGLLWWLVPNEGDEKKEIIGYFGQGYLGQYLLIFPAKKLIAIRLIRYQEEYDQEDMRKKVSFADFPELVNALVKEM